MKPALFLSLASCGLLLCSSCAQEYKPAPPTNVAVATDSVTLPDSVSVVDMPASAPIITQDVKPQEVVNFAQTLIGVPYKYASTDPAVGFDCSGFITYVFNHFNIKVPRSSVDFTNVGYEIHEPNAAPGDLILFTGTDSSVRVVGHMGIVTENIDTLRFIHSTSGRQYGVTVTPLSKYYRGRFVKVIRIF